MNESFKKEEEDEGARELNFGEYLRRERTLRGISQEEICKATRVHEDYIKALENNKFELLPPKTFVVGFLRAMSRYAGLDSEEVVNRFLSELAHQEMTVETLPSAKNQKKKTFPRWGWILIFLLFLVLLFLPLCVKKM